MRYEKAFRVKVAKDALQLDEGQEYLIANKYWVRESTVIRWKKLFEKFGESGLDRNMNILLKSESIKDENYKKIIAQKDKELFELQEENEILKKAAAFLAELNRN